MMRPVLVLAMLAALCGAPSSLLAASPDPTPQFAPSDTPAVPGGNSTTGTASPAPSAEPRPAKSGTPTAQPRTGEAPTAGGPASRDGRRGRPTGGGSRPGRGDRSHPAPAASASPTVGTASEPSMVHDERMLPLAIVVGVSAILLLTTGWLLAAQGRDPGPAPVGARRAPRRAERAAAHDPVLAALGLDEDEPAPPTGSG